MISTARIRRTGIIAAMAVLSIAAPAWAHDLGIECKARGQVMEVLSFYDDDTPCRQGKVTVERMDKSIEATGKTDDKGLWSFPRPKAGKYLIVVNDGAGHLAKLKITVSDEAPKANAPKAPPTDSPSPDASTEPSPNGTSVGEGPTRAEFTQPRWRGLAIGLVAIVLIGGGLRFFLRRRSEASHSS